MIRNPWDGVMPGGRLGRPRSMCAVACAAGAELPSPWGTTPRRCSAAVYRVRRVAPGRRSAVAIAAGGLALAMFAAIATSSGATGSTARAVAQPGAAALDARVRLLATELQLTPEQQSKVRALLARQREQVQQLWREPDMAPPLRIGRMQAIGDRTADAIRGLLDEAQRQKYIQPRQREAAVGAAGADVEGWIASGARQ